MTLLLPSDPLHDFSGPAFIIVAVICGICYFLPTIIAFLRGKRSAVAVGALNFFLGWTFLGWIASLVWSLSSEPKPQRIIINQPPTVRNEDHFDKLSRLKRLLDEEAITRDEYESEKRKILGN